MAPHAKESSERSLCGIVTDDFWLHSPTQSRNIGAAADRRTGLVKGQRRPSPSSIPLIAAKGKGPYRWSNDSPRSPTGGTSAETQTPPGRMLG